MILRKQPSAGEARQKLIDFRKNALNQRKKRDTDVPSRSSMLHTINEAKKHENALADIAYGEKKKLQEFHDRSKLVYAISYEVL